MISKPNTFYQINLLFCILSFLVTISFRAEMVYGAINNWTTASNILGVWNWLMLFSLGVATIQTLILMRKFGGIGYCLLEILIIIMLVITAFGMFIIRPGALLS